MKAKAMNTNLMFWCLEDGTKLDVMNRSSYDNFSELPMDYVSSNPLQTFFEDPEGSGRQVCLFSNKRFTYSEIAASGLNLEKNKYLYASHQDVDYVYSYEHLNMPYAKLLKRSFYDNAFSNNAHRCAILAHLKYEGETKTVTKKIPKYIFGDKEGVTKVMTPTDDLNSHLIMEGLIQKHCYVVLIDTEFALHKVLYCTTTKEWIQPDNLFL